MTKSIKIWLLLILLPVPLYLSMFLLGLIGLAGYWGYYMPLWDLGEPFFKYSSDTGWYYPTIYGHLLAAMIYSIVYWCGYLFWKEIRR
jgi:hypothetical protein